VTVTFLTRGLTANQLHRNYKMSSFAQARWRNGAWLVGDRHFFFSPMHPLLERFIDAAKP
jgi:hypothetical protein